MEEQHMKFYELVVTRWINNFFTLSASPNIFRFTNSWKRKLKPSTAVLACIWVPMQPTRKSSFTDLLRPVRNVSNNPLKDHQIVTNESRTTELSTALFAANLFCTSSNCLRVLPMTHWTVYCPTRPWKDRLLGLLQWLPASPCYPSGS